MLGKWHLNIFSTFTFQFFMIMGEAEEKITPNVGLGDFFQLWTHGSLDVIYTISDQIAIANNDGLRIDCWCCLEATQKIENF
jgi:hypothetical protein